MMRSQAIRDVGKLLSGGVLAKLFGVAALMLFTRILSRDQLAVFPAYLMLIGLPNLFLSFGIFQTFVRKLPVLIRQDLARARSLVWTGSAIILGGTMLVSLLSYLGSASIAVFIFKDAGKDWIIQVMPLAFMAFAVSRIVDSVMWGRAQFGATSLLQIVESILRPCMTVGFYFAFGFTGIAVGLVTGQIVMAAISLWFVRDFFLGPRPALYPVGQLIRESLPFYFDNYLWYLKGDGDTLLVSAFLGPTMLAEYYVAKTLYTNVTMAWISLDRVVLERLARFGETSDAFRAMVTDVHARISQTSIPLVLLAIAVTPYAMIVLGGARYAAATWPAIALLCSALMQFVFMPANRAIFVGLSGTWRLATSAVEATAVLFAAALLVPIAGIMGIAAARTVGPLAGGIFASILLSRKIGLSLPFGATFLALAATFPGALLVLLFAPPAHGIAAALGGAVLATLVYGFSFAALSYVINRAAFDVFTASVASRYRAAFSP